MSLTKQLYDGRLGRWCERHFVGTARVVWHVRSAVAATKPVQATGKVDKDKHWADVGRAFTQRLADLVDPSPPYRAMLGMIGVGWLSWARAHVQAAAYPGRAELPEQHRGRALSLRRTPAGWLDLGPRVDRDPIQPEVEVVMLDLLERTRAYQAEHIPHGEWGTRGAEMGLARSLWVLGACEGMDQTGRLDWRLSGVVHHGGGVAELRALPTESVVAELVELAGRARALDLVGQCRDIVEQLLHGESDEPVEDSTMGVAAPVLIPGWVEGDLLIGSPRATMLVDVKTAAGGLYDTQRVTRWCWQLLAHAWLDSQDLHRVRAVALYMARFGVLIPWSVRTLAAELLGTRDPDRIEDARREFRDIAKDVLREEGVKFRIT